MVSGEVVNEIRVPLRFLRQVFQEINDGVLEGQWTFETESGYKYVFTKPKGILSVDIRQEAL